MNGMPLKRLYIKSVKSAARSVSVAASEKRAVMREKEREKSHTPNRL